MGRSDYTPEQRAAWQRKRLEREMERGLYSKDGPVAQHLAGTEKIPHAHENPLKARKGGIDVRDEFAGMKLTPNQKKILDEVRVEDLLDKQERHVEKQGAKLEKRVAKSLKEQKKLNKYLIEHAPKHAKLSGDADSSFIEHISWRDGVCTVSIKGYGDYEYEMDRSTFIEFANADSTGEFFNAEVRE